MGLCTYGLAVRPYLLVSQCLRVKVNGRAVALSHVQRHVLSFKCLRHAPFCFMFVMRVISTLKQCEADSPPPFIRHPTYATPA